MASSSHAVKDSFKLLRGAALLNLAAIALGTILNTFLLLKFAELLGLPPFTLSARPYEIRYTPMQIRQIAFYFMAAITPPLILSCAATLIRLIPSAERFCSWDISFCRSKDLMKPCFYLFYLLLFPLLALFAAAFSYTEAISGFLMFLALILGLFAAILFIIAQVGFIMFLLKLKERFPQFEVVVLYILGFILPFATIPFEVIGHFFRHFTIILSFIGGILFTAFWLLIYLKSRRLLMQALA
ncbi:MAG: hypothetical protein ACP5LQ_08725 [Candidatus Methanodesulfokora sp.]